MQIGYCLKNVWACHPHAYRGRATPLCRLLHRTLDSSPGGSDIRCSKPFLAELQNPPPSAYYVSFLFKSNQCSNTSHCTVAPFNVLLKLGKQVPVRTTPWENCPKGKIWSKTWKGFFSKLSKDKWYYAAISAANIWFLMIWSTDLVGMFVHIFGQGPKFILLPIERYLRLNLGYFKHSYIFSV